MTGIGLGCAFLAGIGLGLSGALLATAVVVLVRLSGQCKTSIVVIAIVLGILGAWRGSEPTEVLVGEIAAGEVRLTGVVASVPTDAAGGRRFDLETGYPSEAIKARFCVDAASGTAVEKGSTVDIEGTITPIEDLSDDAQGAFRSRQCSGSLEASSVSVLSRPSRVDSMFNAIRTRTATLFQRAAPGDTGALMTGLVTGDDNALSFIAKSAFLATGTTHITAVSGSNFALIALIATAVSGGPGTRRRLPWLTAATMAIWFYAVLVGLPPSALRAALMASLALVALRFGRRPDFLTLLVICGALQLALRPSDLHSLSFQLSFVATSALVLVFSERHVQPRRLLGAVVVTAVAAHLATVPILAFRLGEIAPATIPANVLISPLTMIGFLLAALSAAIGLVSPSLGTAAAIPAAFISEAILAVVKNTGNWLPGRWATGAASTGSLVALSIVSWSIVLAMSGDVRNSVARTWKWSGESGVLLRMAILGAPLVAVTVYGIGTLSR